MNKIDQADPLNEGWIRSTFCGSTVDCVMIRFEPDVVLMSDSKNGQNSTGQGNGPILRIPYTEWTLFLTAVIDCESVPKTTTLELSEATDEGVTIRPRRGGSSLSFTKTEWDAFVTGVKNSEFDLTSV